MAEVNRMFWFLIGCMAGGTVGMTAMCFCTAASRADEKLHADDLHMQ